MKIRIILPSYEGFTIIFLLRFRKPPSFLYAITAIIRWTEGHGDWADMWEPFKSKGAKQKDRSCVSIRHSRAYKFLLESLMLKIFSHCHNNRTPAILTLVVVPWVFPGCYHRLLGVCVSLADFQILLWVYLRYRPSSDLSIPRLCLAKHQEMSVNGLRSPSLASPPRWPK